MATPDFQPLEVVAEQIKQAWKQGRPIVPIIGAGASADAGIPTIAALFRYIAKLRAFVDGGFYLPTRLSSAARARCKELYDGTRGTLADFLDDHGWLDRFDLTDDLSRALARTSPPVTMQSTISDALARISREMNPSGTAQISNALESLLGHITEPSPDLLHTLRLADLASDVLIDWRPLIRHITDHRQYLADSLFTQLHASRLPSQFHRYLAHLIRLLGVRAVFTYNFDPLIENALSDEGLAFQLFAMEFGTSLPPAVLATRLAVIKMHGSTHNLLIDERIDYPLTSEYKARFAEVAGLNPLLLVLGCSGRERRLLDLLELVASHPSRHRSSTDHRHDCPAIIWTHFAEPMRDRAPVPLLKGLPGVVSCLVRDLGACLSYIYTHITSRLPAARRDYVAHTVRLFASPTHPSSQVFWRTPPTTFFDTGRSVHKQVLLLDSTDGLAPKRAARANTLPTILSFISSLPTGYSLIYVDLEEQHTLGGIVSKILNDARMADTDLMPLRLPISSASETVSINIPAAVRRVHHALRRTRIALVFDSLDSFDWRATTHHGFTSHPAPESLRDGWKDVKQFIDQLVQMHLAHGHVSESVICLGLDPLSPRHPNNRREELAVELREKELRDWLSELNLFAVRHIATPTRPSDAPGDLRQDKLHTIAADDMFIGTPPETMFLRAACTIRRTRSPNMLRCLYDEVFDGASERPKDGLATLLDTYARERILIPAEGGAMCMERPYRNALYSAITSATSSVEVARALAAPKDQDRLYKVVRQLADGMALHDVCARVYYNFEFLPSRDPFYFLEYAYHRVSGLRYLTDLLLVTRWCKGASGILSRYLHKQMGLLLPEGTRGRGTFCRRVYRLDASVVASGDMTGSAFALEVLESRYATLLCGLVRSWERTEVLLRDAVSPDLLLAWCGTLREYDLGRNLSLPKRLTYLRSRLHEEVDPAKEPPLFRNPLPGERSLKDSGYLNQLRSVVHETEVRCMYERGDFMSMLDHRLKALCELTGQSEAVLRSNVTPSVCRSAMLFELVRAVQAMEESDRRRAEGIHALLDAMIAQHWHVFSNAETDREGVPMLDEYFSQRAAIDKVVAQIVSSGDVVQRDLESVNRWLYVCVERALGMRSMVGAHSIGAFGVAAFVEHRDGVLPRESFAELRRTAEAAIEGLQDEQGIFSGRMRNPFLNSTEDQTLLIPYRALFRVLAGRALVGQAREEGSEGVFEQAYREFELARSSVGYQNRALLTLCEVCAAEAANEHAEFLLVLGTREPAECASKILAKLRSARAYLDAALVSMRNGGRHVLLWRFLSLAMARYSVLRMIGAAGVVWQGRGNGLGKMGDDPAVIRGAIRRAGGLVRIARYGLQAIRDGLDHTPGEAQRFRAGFFELWHELLCVSYIGATFWAAGEIDLRDESIISEFLAWWEHLNECCGLAAEGSAPWRGCFERAAKEGFRDDAIVTAIDLEDASASPLSAGLEVLHRLRGRKGGRGLCKDWWNRYGIMWNL